MLAGCLLSSRLASSSFQDLIRNEILFGLVLGAYGETTSHYRVDRSDGGTSVVCVPFTRTYGILIGYLLLLNILWLKFLSKHSRETCV